MRKLLLAADVLALAGCGGEGDDERPGLASVYADIETMECPRTAGDA